MSTKNEQYNQLKEEILNIIQSQQSQIFEEIDKKVTESNAIIEENKRIIECFLEQKYQIDKIEHLEKLFNKINDTLISHEIKISNNDKELGSIKIKYDKLILDNLMIAGLIGPSCPYKNLSSYLKYQISEFNRMRFDNESVKKETKDFRIKLDGVSKDIINLIDGGVLRCNNYADNRINDFHVVLENKIKEMNDKLMDIRMKNIQFQNKIETEIKNLKTEYEEKMEKQKEDLSQIINNKIEYLNMNYSSLEKNQKIVEMDTEIKNNYTQIDKEIKEIKLILQSIPNIKDININLNAYTTYNSSNIPGDYKKRNNKRQSYMPKENDNFYERLKSNNINNIINPSNKNNYRNSRQLLSPVKSKFYKNNMINNTSPNYGNSFKENSVNKRDIYNEITPRKFNSKSNLINLSEKINLIENMTDNYTETINTKFHNKINNNSKSNTINNSKNNSNNNIPSLSSIRNGLSCNDQNKKNKIKNTYSLENAINERSQSFISISNLSKQDNNEYKKNIDSKNPLFNHTKDDSTNNNFNKSSTIIEKKILNKNTLNKQEMENSTIENKLRNYNIEISDNNESKINTKTFNKSQNSYRDEIVKELFSKYNKESITTNLNLVKNKANLDLYNYSIAPPDKKFILNAKINEIIEPPAKELFFDKKNLFDKDNRHSNTKRNISLRPSLNMQIFYGNYNDKKKEKIKKPNHLSTSDQKINLKTQKNNPKKNQTFGKTTFSEYVNSEDLFTMTSYKNKNF